MLFDDSLTCVPFYLLYCYVTDLLTAFLDLTLARNKCTFAPPFSLLTSIYIYIYIYIYVYIYIYLCVGTKTGQFRLSQSVHFANCVVANVFVFSILCLTADISIKVM